MFRFKIAPNIVKKSAKEVNMEESSITAQFWHGLYCYEKCQIEGSQTFPMTEEGRQNMKSWLESNI